ncbi:MAG: isoprenylcysteine carboxylmethyltransferase family protein [Roseiarcus sp.]|uniref:methyltransferase family protein n=1 Tax=Roseiarcus sp. TaxID=1969460 RepID=UPI003C1BB2A8
MIAAAIVILWLVWIVVWIAMARGVKSVAERAKGSRAHYLPMTLAVVLLAAPRLPLFPLDVRFVPAALWPAALGLALTFAGLAFAFWARARLADNWSSSVTLKRDHELIDDGPYRWVRHPIYTGLLVALAGAALAVGEWRGVIAVALAAVALWRKLRLEEAVMRRQFGDTYDRYAERTRALIPFVL